MQKKYLLAPGPTPVPPEALLAMAMPIIHHRAPDFLPVLDSAKKGLQWLYQTKNDVLILCSTGTGGMVGSVTNFLSPGDDVLVVNGGKFGERWTKICQAYGMKVEELIVEWGHAVKAEQVEAALKKNPKIKAVFIQANETSTGVYHDVKSVAAVVKKTDALFVVDAISALVAHDIRTDEWGIDVMIGGSQKGVMLPPGARLRVRLRQGMEDGRYGQDAEVLFQFQERAREPGQEPDEFHLGGDAHHRAQLLHQDAPG